jgi:hypothetical protein
VDGLMAFATLPERADALEAIGLIMIVIFFSLLQSLSACVFGQPCPKPTPRGKIRPPIKIRSD